MPSAPLEARITQLAITVQATVRCEAICANHRGGSGQPGALTVEMRGVKGTLGSALIFGEHEGQLSGIRAKATLPVLYCRVKTSTIQTNAGPATQGQADKQLIESLISNHDASVKHRARMEAAIILSTIRALTAKGYELQVDDGDGDELCMGSERVLPLRCRV